MAWLRHTNARKEVTVAQIIPFAPAHGPSCHAFDFGAPSAFGITVERRVHVSCEIVGAEERHQKLNLLDQGLLELMADAQIITANLPIDCE